MDRKEIEAARQAGIIDDAKAAELEAFMTAERGPGASSDDESLRFLANFNDIFISVGLVLLSIGMVIGSGLLLGASGNAIIILLPVLAILWALLEYFAGRRRLLLPSMTLSVIFGSLVMLLTALVASGFSNADSLVQNAVGSVSEGFDAVNTFGLWAGLGGMAAAGAIYARFRLPFSLFLMALGVAFIFYVTSATNGNTGALFGGGASFIIGIGTLIVAIVFDGRDPARKALSSDNAFWLHMAAAPQIMLGLRALLSGGVFSTVGSGEAAVLLLALAGFSILSLALNRRALIAAGLLSFWVSISALASGTGSETMSFVIPLLLLGGGIVLLGAGWKTARRMVLAYMPKTGVFARIFPPEPA
ncbi:MAG: hypothetical protein ABJG15_12765 [Hyphomonadaceae bacterium]